MKRFNFRLQKYLSLKRQQEDIQRLILSNAQTAYDAEQRALELIEERIKALLEYNTTLRQRQLNIELLLFAESYHIVLSQQKESQAVSVENALSRVAAEREKYLTLQKDRKLLERLREKLWQQFYQDSLSDEQKALDEIGTSRSGFRVRGSIAAEGAGKIGHSLTESEA
jgi:flagellar FliJ protein